MERFIRVLAWFWGFGWGWGFFGGLAEKFFLTGFMSTGISTQVHVENYVEAVEKLCRTGVCAWWGGWEGVEVSSLIFVK